MPTGSTARRIIRKTRIFLLVAPLLIVASVSSAQNAAITPNYKNADIGQVIEAVSALTGKNFIVDPRVKAQVTMISSTPLSADAFYEAFLSILQVYGFVAVQSGDIIKIMPDANARQMPAVDLPGKLPSAGDEIVTQVVQVQNVNAAQLVPILRPLIPQYGHLAAHPDSNMLIISDRSANVARMASIIRRIDGAGAMRMWTSSHCNMLQRQKLSGSSARFIRVIVAAMRRSRASVWSPTSVPTACWSAAIRAPGSDCAH